MDTYQHPDAELIGAIAQRSGHDFASVEQIQTQVSGWRCLRDGWIRSTLRRHDPQLYSHLLNGNGIFFMILIPLLIAAMGAFLISAPLGAILAILTLPLCFLFGGLMCFDALTIARKAWSKLIFSSQLHGADRRQLDQLLGCVEVSDSPDSRALIREARATLDQSKAVKASDILKGRADVVTVEHPDHVEVVAPQQSFVARLATLGRKTKPPHLPTRL